MLREIIEEVQYERECLRQELMVDLDLLWNLSQRGLKDNPWSEYYIEILDIWNDNNFDWIHREWE